MENATPPYPPNPELHQPHPGQPLPPASSGVQVPSAGLMWLVAGLALGLAGHVLQIVLLRGWSFGYSEWPMMISQFLVYAGTLVGAVGAVAIGVRIALPNGR